MDIGTSQTYLWNLARAQVVRFQDINKIADLENAISNVEKALEQMDDGHLDKPKYLVSLSACHNLRFHRLRDLADLENAVSNKETLLNSRIGETQAKQAGSLCWVTFSAFALKSSVTCPISTMPS